MSNARFRTALLGSGAAVALMAASVPASADEIDELRGQIEAMQSKLATLEQNQAATEQEAQYTAAPANAVVGGDKPGSFRLPGSNTSVAIGGYAKLDIIYDINNDQGDSFSFASIPTNDPPASARSELDENFRMHAKQSRLWVKTWTPTDWGEFATHVEGDFEGGGGNQVFSNSDHFRLRHAYGSLGNVLAGQTWSNFNTPFEWPGTIDFFGTIGTSFIRQAQLRYTAPLGNGMSLAIAIENPEMTGIACNSTGGGGNPSTSCSSQTAVTATVVTAVNTMTMMTMGLSVITSVSLGTTTSTAQVGGNLALGGNEGPAQTDPAPDITARFQWGADWGTVAVAGVGRYFRVVETNFKQTAYSGDDDTEFGWGINAAAVFNLPWGKDSFGVGGLYGDGIGRYALWAPAAVVAFDQGNGGPGIDLETVTAWGANAWYEHWWTDTLLSVVSAGYARNDWPSDVKGHDLGLNDHIWSSHANLQWRPIGRATIGIEGSYGHRETTGGMQGDATRIQMGFQWGFST